MKQLRSRENSTMTHWQQISERACKAILPERTFYKYLGHENPTHFMAHNFFLIDLAQNQYKDALKKKKSGVGKLAKPAT